MKVANLFYKSKQWERKRENVLKRDRYECRECKRYGKVTGAQMVHHVKPFEQYPELKLENNNLISLCNKCHGSMHDRTTNELTDKGRQWIERTERVNLYAKK